MLSNSISLQLLRCCLRSRRRRKTGTQENLPHWNHHHVHWCCATDCSSKCRHDDRSKNCDRYAFGSIQLHWFSGFTLFLRFLHIHLGLGNGMNTSTSPVWQSETTKPSLRGKLIVFGMMFVPCLASLFSYAHDTLFCSMNVAGFSLSNWMTYGFSFLSGSISWRFPIAFQLLFSIILFATVPWLPESPRWLLSQSVKLAETDKVKSEQCAHKALHILSLLEDTDMDDERVLAEKKEIVDAVTLELDARIGWGDMLRGNTGNTGMMKRFILGIGVQWFQQLVGINVTSY